MYNLIQFGASERVSRVNWFSSGLQMHISRRSIGSVFGGFRARFASQLGALRARFATSQLVQRGASERVSRVN